LTKLRSQIKSTKHTLEQIVLHWGIGRDLLVYMVICGESPRVNQRRWTKVGRRQLVHPSTPLITSVERNCLHGSLWLIQPRWSTWGNRVNTPLKRNCLYTTQLSRTETDQVPETLGYLWNVRRWTSPETD